MAVAGGLLPTTPTRNSISGKINVYKKCVVTFQNDYQLCLCDLLKIFVVINNKEILDNVMYVASN